MGLPVWMKKIKPYKSPLTAAQKAQVADGTVAKKILPQISKLKKRLAWGEQTEMQFEKSAKSLELIQLIKAKKLSDKGDYKGKNQILGSLLSNHLSDFKIDSKLNERYIGLTHKPSGFRIHAPRKLIPPNIEGNA